MLNWIRRKEPALTDTQPGRFERKFFLPPAKIPFAMHLLKHLCPPDRNYPEGRVNSVYYDTPELEFYHDSDEGNYQRKKIRIRWYDEPQRTGDSATMFLELKSKYGFRGVKQRQEFVIPSHRLGQTGMREGLAPYPRFLRILSEFGYYPEHALQPMIFITYKRLRFTDMDAGTRISLDWDIRSRLVSPQWDRWEGLLPMEGGVVEIKGLSASLPPILRSLRFLEIDWSRYSKYGSCMESQLDTVGSPGRSWPAGRTGYR